MANATRKTIEKTVTEDVIVLELTKDEVEVIRGALNFFQASPTQACILRALDAPSKTDDRPIQVGDKVRVTQVGIGDSVYLHRIGTVGYIGFDHIPYRVDFTDGDWAWVKSVERVSD